MTDFRCGFITCLGCLAFVAIGAAGPIIVEGWLLIPAWIGAVCLWLSVAWLVLYIFVPESWREASNQEREP